MPSADGEPKGKRNLVRWDDDKDKQLLLCLQYVCAQAGIRIPWEDVATQMGPRFSGGACVQHLAKLRTRMKEENVPVPPPIPRGLVTSKPSAIYAKSGGTKKRKLTVDGDIDFEQEEVEPLNPAVSTPKSKKRKTIKKEPGIKEESDGNISELYDSDAEWGAKRKKASTKKTPKKVSKKKGGRKSSSEEPSASTEKTPTASPTSPINRTRGNRPNYTIPDPAIIEDDSDEQSPAKVEGDEPTVAQSPEKTVSEEEVKHEDSISNGSPSDAHIAFPVAQPQSAPPSTPPKEELLAATDTAQPQQMHAPAPYYMDFGGHYANFNPHWNFNMANQTAGSSHAGGWGAANNSYGTFPQQHMFNPPTPDTQQNKKGSNHTQWHSQPNQFFNNGFNGNMLNSPLNNRSTNITMPAFTSSMGLAEDDLRNPSRNNSKDSYNSQDTLLAAPARTHVAPTDPDFNEFVHAGEVGSDWDLVDDEYSGEFGGA